MVGLTALSDMYFSSKTHFSSQQPSHTNTHKPKHNTDTHRDTTEKDTHTHMHSRALKRRREAFQAFSQNLVITSILEQTPETSSMRTSPWLLSIVLTLLESMRKCQAVLPLLGWASPPQPIGMEQEFHPSVPTAFLSAHQSLLARSTAVL